MTDQLQNAMIGCAGLLAGVAASLILQLIYRRHGMKKRLFDERQQLITNQAKAAGWNVTTFLLIVAWALIIVFDGISIPFFLMTGVFVLHNVFYLFSSMYHTSRNG
ncbi:DUF2178 domain-containing protein [Paenibacillus sp. USDA918EY]|uniref:DUF2178 domain-containing protein n=1 Tax=Paenibacillus sp. USDA918EY TaxID=2689575 RepID=UPI001356AC8F|nr:DUF2178 domain-containing protein [Paenibacillus sp. USDA918EY]